MTLIAQYDPDNQNRLLAFFDSDDPWFETAEDGSWSLKAGLHLPNLVQTTQAHYDFALANQGKCVVDPTTGVIINIGALPPSARELEEQAKLTGFDFQGTMCSYTKRDMDGLDAIDRAFDKGWVPAPGAEFTFRNGNKLKLLDANRDAFGQAFFAARSALKYID